MGTEYFLHHPWIGVLSNIPVLLGVGAISLLAIPAFRRLLGRHPVAWVGATWFLTRILFLVLVVGIFHHVSTDLSSFFETQGMAALQGKMPYRDFVSSYSPLFPYLMMLPAAVRGGAAPFFVFFAICDLVVLAVVWAGMARTDRNLAPVAAWAYAAAPVTWYFLVRYGQDEALAAAFLALAWLLCRRNHETAAALLFGLGCAATKFTVALFLPPFVISARKPLRFAVSAALAGAVLFLPFLLAGAPVWQPVIWESGGVGAGPSLWRLPVYFTSLRLGWWSALPLAGALVVTWWAGGRTKHRQPLEAQLLATGCVFLIISPKIMPEYAAQWWPFAAVWLSRSARPADLHLAAVLNLLLGTWAYFDAGGPQGTYGPIVFALSVAMTAAIPVALMILEWRVLRRGYVPQPLRSITSQV